MQTQTHSPQPTQQQASSPDALTDAREYARQTRVKFIFLHCFLKASRSAEALLQNYRKAQKRSSFAPETPLTASLWEGQRALKTEAEVCADRLTERGQLLYAFEGTTVLQGGAA